MIQDVAVIMAASWFGWDQGTVGGGIPLSNISCTVSVVFCVKLYIYYLLITRIGIVS